MGTIEMKMSSIYHASHDVLPAKAAGFGQQAEVVSDSIEPIVREVALAGNHPIGRELGDVATELFLHLRSLVRTFNDSATGLDQIADDFTRVDTAAGDWLDQHRRFIGDPDRTSEPTPPRV